MFEVFEKIIRQLKLKKINGQICLYGKENLVLLTDNMRVDLFWLVKSRTQMSNEHQDYSDLKDFIHRLNFSIFKRADYYYYIKYFEILINLIIETPQCYGLITNPILCHMLYKSYVI
jgi:hypothetical protein